MRKRFAMSLILALLTLAACTGAENYAPTPTPRPTVTRSPLFPPTPTPPPPAEPITYEPVDVPDYYPPLDFEVESVWRAKAPEYEGDAVMYMSAEKAGVRTFKVFMYNYTEYTSYDGKAGERTISLNRFTADAYGSGGKLNFSSQAGFYANLYGLSSLHGELTIDGDTATIRYTKVEEDDLRSEGDCIVLDMNSETPLLRYVSANSGQNYTQYLPTQFTRVPEDEAGQAMYAMPMFPEEIIIPPLDGKPAEDYASSFAYTSDDPAYIPDLRGIKLGDSLMSVMSRFMCEPEKLAVIERTYDGAEYAVVYGTYTYWANDCRIIYENGKPASIIFVCQVDMWIQFYLDENLCVGAVSYVEPW